MKVLAGIAAASLALIAGGVAVVWRGLRWRP